MLKQPRNITSKVSITNKIQMRWNDSLATDFSNREKAALKYVTKLIESKSNELYVSRDTDELVNSSSTVETGHNTAEVRWSTEYASSVYLNTETELKGKRGPLWFDRMYADYRHSIMTMAMLTYIKGDKPGSYRGGKLR